MYGPAAFMPGVFMFATGTTCAGKLAGAVAVLPGAAVCRSVAPEAEQGGGLGARWWGAI